MLLNDSQRLTLIRNITNGQSIEEVLAFLDECKRANTKTLAPPTDAMMCLWRGGFKIDAIKAYREHFKGAGLKETKDLFETL
jgi:ribosomal protein L7/L12